MENIELLPQISTKIYDTHAHFDDDAFDPVRDGLFSELQSYGVGCIINNATDLEKSAEDCLNLSKKYDFCYTAIGVHPGTVEQTGVLPEKARLLELLKKEKVVAVGEIGLDYHWSTDFKDLQKKAFVMQCEAAGETGLPVIIHDRDAHGDTFDIVRQIKPKGTIHCYSGSADLAYRYVEMGMYIGVGGVVTFNNARKLVETVEEIPLQRILLETDAPYLAPVPYRGKLCHSGYIYFVAQKIAEIKKTDVNTVLEVTASNARQLYGVK